MTSATTETNGHKAEFGMTGTTFTGDSTTLKREAYLQSLGLPDEKASGELVRRLIKNVISIKDETGEFLLHLPGGKVVDTKSWMEGWEWTHGVGLYGILKSYQVTSDPAMLQTMVDWFDHQFAKGTPSKNVNTVAPFLTLAYLYEITKESKYLAYLDAWAEWVMNDLPRTKSGGFCHTTYVSDHDGQLWDDTLMMTVLPLAKIGLLLNRPKYVQEAKKQVLIHIKFLQDKKTGLFFHGWTDHEGGHNYANALWARGNSWLTIFIPEFLTLLSDSSTSPSPTTFASDPMASDDDFLRSFLISVLKEQVDALVETQDTASGLWHTLIDEPSSYLESSATAGFAYGMLHSLRKGYLKGDKYEAVALRSVKGIVERIAADGELADVSFGTPVFSDLQGYRDVPLTSMAYGQSMAMLLMGEFKRRFL